MEPRPVVGFPLATRFNGVVAMDIKEIRSHKVLHLVDHATRYSVAARIPNKESSSILLVIFKNWISYFGAPGKFLTHNGREFDNEHFRDMAQNFNVIVKILHSVHNIKTSRVNGGGDLQHDGRGKSKVIPTNNCCICRCYFA